MSAYVSHRQLSPEDFQQLLAWYKIRDTLFGENEVKQDVKKALELAANCEYPDAVWLTKLFAGRDTCTWNDARQVFRSIEGDPKAHGFAALLVWDFSEILRVAELGDAYAQARLAGQTRVGKERFRWSENSAALGERDGFSWLGYCYENGYGCEKDVARMKELRLIACELGSVYCMTQLGCLLDKSDPQRFFWLGKASACGRYSSFFDDMAEEVGHFNSGTGHANVVFAIGRTLKGHIDNKKRHLFGSPHYHFDTLIGPANQAVGFYKFQLQSCRKAVDTWTVVGIRNNVIKDIRILIAKMIWESREEAKY